MNEWRDVSHYQGIGTVDQSAAAVRLCTSLLSSFMPAQPLLFARSLVRLSHQCSFPQPAYNIRALCLRTWIHRERGIHL